MAQFPPATVGTLEAKMAARSRCLARLPSQETLISDATHGMLGATDEFEFGDGTTVQLKGMEGHHTIRRLI